MKLLSLLFIIVTLPITSSAQSLTTKLDKLLESYYNDMEPGATVLISKKGRPIYQNQIGLANMEYQIPIQKDTKFPIGSITKQFTAAAILMLEEQGKLNTTDYIGAYLSDFPKEKYLVTIEHLLLHTSGIPDFPRVQEIRKQMRNNLSPEDIIEIIKKEPLNFEAGTSMRYSNTGYLLLGMIIEKIANQTYAEFLKENIFQSLKMSNTTLSHYEDIIPNRATGYSEDYNDELINATYHTSSHAAGAIVSTPTDLNRWITALRGSKLLNEKSLKKMFHNYTLTNGKNIGLGYGWEINEIADNPTFEHSGFEPGYKCNSVYIPSEELYIIVLQNNEYGSPTPFMLQAAAMCINQPYPNEVSAISFSKEKHQKFVGTYKFENEEERIIGIKNGALYYKERGGAASPLFIANDHTLFFKEGYRQLIFEQNESTTNGILYKNRGYTLQGHKMSNEVPEEKKLVSIPVTTLEQYVGDYKTERFEMTISLEEGVLFAQPEGSNKVPLAATAANAFIIEEIGAELEFQLDENKESKYLIILIDGDQVKGVRK